MSDKVRAAREAWKLARREAHQRFRWMCEALPGYRDTAGLHYDMACERERQACEALLLEIRMEDGE
jgi:hypothetical protein